MVTQNLFNSDNVEVVAQLGGMQVVQYKKDMSVSTYTSRMEYYMSKMDVQRRQLLLNLNGDSYTVQAGAMQWMSGKIQMNSGVTGVGNFLKKVAQSAVTSESAAKPIYTGTGQVMLEPTYRHIILTNLSDWGGSVVLDDGLFLACESIVQHKVVARTNISSALLGGEGLFNLCLFGEGLVALESIVPRQELIEIVLDNDTLRVDGNMAVAWSSTLSFTVEKSSKSLIGSAISGEGFVNVYHGSGKVWLAPVLQTKGSAGESSAANAGETESAGRTGSLAGKSDVVNKLEKVGKVMDFFS